jgi:hypothetical protein
MAIPLIVMSAPEMFWGSTKCADEGGNGELMKWQDHINCSPTSGL